MTALRCTAFTDVGPNRKNNQDSAYASPRLLVLADGMGGQAAGDLASAVAVQTVRRLDRPPEGDPLEALAGATHRANDRLSELVEQDAELEGMGTTLIAMVFEAADGGPDRLQVAHVGDSRAYLLRGGQIQQLTKDHTFVQSLVDEGRITAAEARTHPHRSLILKALQGGHTVEPDLFPLDVSVGDRILLCSDGLSDYVDLDVIGAALGDGSIEMAATNLVQLALEARTTDNVTCVVAEVVPDEDADPAAQPLLVGSVASAPRPPTGSRSTGSLPAVEHDGDDDYADEQVDLEELRYAPRSRRRNSWLLRFAVVAVVLLALTFGVTWLYDWTQSKYFVAESDGSVAVYRGVPLDVPGVSLSSVHEVTDLAVADLPEYSQQKWVDGIGSDDLESAEATVAELQALAADCASTADKTAACDDSATTGGAG